jgi:hypothetical protein
MKVLQFLKNLRLSFKAIVVVVLAFVTLQIALSNVGRIAVGRLITQVGQNRAEQEAEVIQSRFAEARQDILKSADYLLSQIPLQDALAQGQSPADIRAMMVVGSHSRFEWRLCHGSTEKRGGHHSFSPTGWATRDGYEWHRYQSDGRYI